MENQKSIFYLNQVPISLKLNEMGIFILGPSFKILFGSVQTNVENLKLNFKSQSFNNDLKIEKDINRDIEICSIKQVHGDVLILANSNFEENKQLLEADAHFTFDKNKALSIKTADCSPIMVTDKRGSFALAIHSGWRGFVNKIHVKSIKSLIDHHGVNPIDLLIFVGPRILQSDFEIDRDVKDNLMGSLSQELQSQLTINSFEKLYFTRNINGREKFYFNLDHLLCLQLSEIGVAQEQFYFTNVNTVASRDWHSYRRDKQNSGRNYSLISLL